MPPKKSKKTKASSSSEIVNSREPPPSSDLTNKLSSLLSNLDSLPSEQKELLNVRAQIEHRKLQAQDNTELGNVAFDSNDLEEAIALYTTALSFDPWNVEALGNRASCFSSLGKFSEAIADGEKVLLIFSKKMNALLKGTGVNEQQLFANFNSISSSSSSSISDPSSSVLLSDPVLQALLQNLSITHYTQATSYHTLKDPQKALSHLNVAL
jgi:tetratricopeptide (TPR) repeat protein